MGSINLFAALIFVALDRTTVLSSRADAGVDSDAAKVSISRNRVAGYYGLITVAALSGFAMMTIQAILNRIGALAFGASMFTFADSN